MSSYEPAVRGWTEHLRAGGTTPWSDWLARAQPTASETTAAALSGAPDATHLEVARRINHLAGRPSPGLVDLVLETGAAGRGLVVVPLAWDQPPRFGSPPAHPEQLPSEELVRLAVAVLGRLLSRVPAGPEDHPRVLLPLPGRRRVRVHGSPGTAAELRAALLERGVADSGWRGTHLVMVRPIDTMMAEHWHARAVQGAAMKWRRVWRRALATDSLPPSLQPASLASGLVASGRPVHVVVAADPARVAALSAEVAGRDVVLPPSPDPAETDLLRRLNRLLTLTEGEDRMLELGAVLRRRVLPDVRTTLRPATSALVAPHWAAAWAADRADRVAEALRRGGYAVHGDPDDLAPVDRARSRGTVDRDRTLGLALAASVRAWQLQGGAR